MGGNTKIVNDHEHSLTICSEGHLSTENVKPLHVVSGEVESINRFGRTFKCRIRCDQCEPASYWEGDVEIGTDTSVRNLTGWKK